MCKGKHDNVFCILYSDVAAPMCRVHRSTRTHLERRSALYGMLLLTVIYRIQNTDSDISDCGWAGCSCKAGLWCTPGVCHISSLCGLIWRCILCSALRCQGPIGLSTGACMEAMLHPPHRIQNTEYIVMSSLCTKLPVNAKLQARPILIRRSPSPTITQAL